MLIRSLIEAFGRGEQVSPETYDTLYHLTDYAGFSNAVKNDILRSRRGEISTTWDETMNHVVGKLHIGFKLVLDAKTLIAKYGAHEYDDYGIYVGTGNRANLDELSYVLRFDRNHGLQRFWYSVVDTRYVDEIYESVSFAHDSTD